MVRNPNLSRVERLCGLEYAEEVGVIRRRMRVSTRRAWKNSALEDLCRAVELLHERREQFSHYEAWRRYEREEGDDGRDG